MFENFNGWEIYIFILKFLKSMNLFNTDNSNNFACKLIERFWHLKPDIFSLDNIKSLRGWNESQMVIEYRKTKKK